MILIKKDQPGGTGESFNWELAIKAKVYNVPIILAGGLAPDNIKRAVETVQPYALDVNSGIEKTPGIKDKKLMEKLFGSMEQNLENTLGVAHVT
ncbi:MAG: N-(5'-phosphoribosyl)anthranilate isomerase [Candidatus Methanoperedenaceae archaeon GB37]|nr:N-(5'-phosphoribosyl)anthranilate isomerase [Candidatus Methanoperedenaceae archaeon GB37]CAD7783777.1 MAG: N-(5'-phosphoribosyl)anthranilate isomerase [Candidatus Methanoperedenaceae archaeon GB37]